jgi:hypothetical protein
MLKYIHQNSFTNISHFSFRTSIIFSSEHHVFFGYELLHDFHSEHPVIPSDVRKSGDEKGQIQILIIWLLLLHSTSEVRQQRVSDHHSHQPNFLIYWECLHNQIIIHCLSFRRKQHKTSHRTIRIRKPYQTSLHKVRNWYDLQLHIMCLVCTILLSFNLLRFIFSTAVVIFLYDKRKVSS